MFLFFIESQKGHRFIVAVPLSPVISEVRPFEHTSLSLASHLALARVRHPGSEETGWQPVHS